MAWSTTLTQLNPGFTVTTDPTFGDPNRFTESYLRSCQNWLDRRWIYLVFEFSGVHLSAPGGIDNSGVGFGLYDLDTDTLVRQSEVVPESTGRAWNYGAPNIALDLTEGIVGDGRVWCVYLVTLGTYNAGSPTTAGYLRAKYSDDQGASWSSEIALDPGITYQTPSVGFAPDGTGFIVDLKRVTSAYNYFQYTGSGAWGAATDLGLGAGINGGVCAVAAGATNRAVAIVHYGSGTTSFSVARMYWDGSTWSGPLSLHTYIGVGARQLKYPKVVFDPTHQEFHCVFGSTDSAQTARAARLDLGGNVIGAVKDLGVTIGQDASGGAEYIEEFIDLAVDEGGHSHFIQGSGDSSPQTYKPLRWNRTDDTLTTTALPSYAGQVIENAGGAVIGVKTPVVQAVIASSKDDTPSSQVQNYYLWSTRNPVAYTVSDAELETSFGDIVKLADFEKYDAATATEVRRLVAYIGDGIYHDAGGTEFVGNLIGNGKFEPIASTANFLDRIYIADGENILKSWDGAAATTSNVTNTWGIATPPQFRGVERHANRRRGGPGGDP